MGADACPRCHALANQTTPLYQPECPACGFRPLQSTTDELERELVRATAKFPDCVKLPDGTGLVEARKTWRAMAQAWCDRAYREGILTHADVFEEEVAEALAESDPVLLRKELVQVGAMVLKWVRDIDSRPRERPTFERLVARVGPLPSTALASAENQAAANEALRHPRSDLYTSAEGRPVCLICGGRGFPNSAGELPLCPEHAEEMHAWLRSRTNEEAGKKPREAAKDAPAPAVPTGYRLADGWKLSGYARRTECDFGDCARNAAMFIVKTPSASIYPRCHEHAVEMGALVPVAAPAPLCSLTPEQRAAFVPISKAAIDSALADGARARQAAERRESPAPQPEAPAGKCGSHLRMFLAFGATGKDRYRWCSPGCKEAGHHILEPLPAEPPSDAGQVAVAETFAQRNRDIEDGRWPPRRDESVQADDCADCGFDQGTEPHHDKKCPRNVPAPSEPAKARCRIATQSACYAPSECDKADRCLGGRGSLVPSEPAKAPLSERSLGMRMRTSPALARVFAAQVAALEARLAEAEKERSALAEKGLWWVRKCDDVEAERDAVRAKSDRWQRNFDEAAKRAHALRVERDAAVATMKHERATCLADARAKEAVLAERERVNCWWMAWLTQQGNKVMTVGERDAGIASGAQPPKGTP